MTKWSLLVAVSLSLAMSASEAAAMLCAQRVVVVQTLEKINEKQTSVALTDSGNLLEVFMSEIGTWTLLMTTPTGVTCVVATGEGWETLPAESEVARLFGNSAGSIEQPTATK